MSGKADTNIITWGLWSLEAVLGFSIYRKQTNGDFAKYAEELVAAIGCCAITVLLVTRATLADADLLGPVEWVDGISTLLFVIVFVIYRRSLKYDDVWPATVAFQFVIIFSAIPLARSTFEHPSNEPLWPWVEGEVKGSTFVVELPSLSITSSPQPVSDASPASDTPAQEPGKKSLINLLS